MLQPTSAGTCGTLQGPYQGAWFDTIGASFRSYCIEQSTSLWSPGTLGNVWRWKALVTAEIPETAWRLQLTWCFWSSWTYLVISSSLWVWAPFWFFPARRTKAQSSGDWRKLVRDPTNLCLLSRFLISSRISLVEEVHPAQLTTSEVTHCKQSNLPPLFSGLCS